MGFLLSLAEVHPIWKPGLAYLQSVELWEQEIVSSNKSVEPCSVGSLLIPLLGSCNYVFSFLGGTMPLEVSELVNVLFWKDGT